MPKRAPTRTPPPQPHLLPQGEQVRCAVVGRRVDENDTCTVVMIRSPKPRGWVLYPHGDAGLGVFLPDDAATEIAAFIRDAA